MRLLIVISLALMFVGCAFPYVFTPPTTNAQIHFKVVDKRPSEERTLRAPPNEIPVRHPIWKYGDEQFSTDRVHALASYFAAAFPNASSNTVLEVDQFEVQQFFPKTIADSSNGAALAALSYPAAIMASSGKNSVDLHDWMLCYLKGTYNGIPFDVFTKVPFEFRGHEPEKAVPPLLDKAFKDAVSQVQSKMINP